MLEGLPHRDPSVSAAALAVPALKLIVYPRLGQHGPNAISLDIGWQVNGERTPDVLCKLEMEHGVRGTARPTSSSASGHQPAAASVPCSVRAAVVRLGEGPPRGAADLTHPLALECAKD